LEFVPWVLWLTLGGQIASKSRVLPRDTRFSVMLFTDIVGSTALKERHGVPAYSEALSIHNRHFERVARDCHLTILQNMGDGYFAEAGGIAEAIRFALLFQAAMRLGPWSEVHLTTRVGIHAGEISAVDSMGGSGIVAPAADLAARVMSLATGGQILLTRFVFDEARHFIREHPPIEGVAPPPLGWLAHGPYLLKGGSDPVEIFEVGAEGFAPLCPPPDGEKAKRAIRPGEEETLGWRPAKGLEIPGRPGWHLIELLGAGGFGEVWAGEHNKLRQLRAFKFCFDDERLRALKREVTLFRLLRSALGERDDIVCIHEIKLDAPPFYLESDLAPHGNLLQWAEKQGGLDQIPLDQRIRLVAHTATALAAAHSIGVLHKDIKPTNILIFDGPDGEPRPRLVDFGIGALAEASVLGQYGVTGAGFTRATIQHSTGTPTYSPPEYVAGKPYTIQGDIYGLGVLLYQLVTAHPLEPLAVGWERDIADPLLREDIAACVDGDPARRLSNAAELAERLRNLEKRRAEIAERDRLTRSEEARARAETEAATAKEKAIRLRRLVAAFAVLALFAVAGGMLAWVFQKRATDARIRAEKSEATAVAQRDRASELLDFQAYSHALERGDLAMAFDRLGRAYARSPRWEYGLGFGRIAAAARASFVPVQRISFDGEPVRGAFCWIGKSSPTEIGKFPSEGRSLLVLASEETIRAYDLANGSMVASHAFEEIRETISLHEIRVLGESNTSGVVAAFRDKPPMVFSLPDLRPVSQGPWDMAGADVAVGRSASVAAAFRGREVVVFDPRSGAELKRKTFQPNVVDRIATVSVQPNGQAVALTSFRLAPLRVWDWRRDEVSSGRRMQGFDFPSDDSILGVWSWQQGGEFVQMMVQHRRALGMCKLWSPGITSGRFAARRIFNEENPSSDFLAGIQDDFGVEFLHISGFTSGETWTGAVGERCLARAASLFPHTSQDLPVKLLASDMANQHLAIRCGDRVDILAPRGALFGEKGVGVAGKNNLPALMSMGRATAGLPCNFWAACNDNDDFWTVNEDKLANSSVVSKFSFAPDGWKVGRKDYRLIPPAGLGGEGATGLVEAAIAKDPTRNSVFILWDKVTSTLHAEDATSLDLMVARYDLPEKLGTSAEVTNLLPAKEFRLSAHPRGGLRVVREFFVDASGEILVYATEKIAAGYSAHEGEVVYRLPASNKFAISPDRRHLALGDWRQKSKVEVRDCRSGDKIMETSQSHIAKTITFSPDGDRLVIGCRTGLMDTYDVHTGLSIQRITTDLSPILLLPGTDRYLGIRLADGSAVGEVFLVNAADGVPVKHMGSSHILSRWYVNPSENVISQVTKYEVTLHRRSTPEQVCTWLDMLWPGGVTPRSQVLAETEQEEISETSLIDDEIGRYRAPPTASPP
jgi:class 3 adenylate cyclase